MTKIYEQEIMIKTYEREILTHMNEKLSDTYNLTLFYPRLIEEWDYNKNTITLDQFIPKPDKKVWWICKECGHRWKTTIYNRLNGSRCPACTNKSTVSTR